MLVLASPAAGREAEFNRWYDDEHLPQMLAIDGFVRARRYRAMTPTGQAPAAHGYVTIYEIEVDAVDDAVAALTAARASGALGSSDAIAPDRVVCFLELVHEAP
jgi:hypothetical protein